MTLKSIPAGNGARSVSPHTPFIQGTGAAFATGYQAPVYALEDISSLYAPVPGNPSHQKGYGPATTGNGWDADVIAAGAPISNVLPSGTTAFPWFSINLNAADIWPASDVFHARGTTPGSPSTVSGYTVDGLDNLIDAALDYASTMGVVVWVHLLTGIQSPPWWIGSSVPNSGSMINGSQSTYVDCPQTNSQSGSTPSSCPVWWHPEMYRSAAQNGGTEGLYYGLMARIAALYDSNPLFAGIVVAGPMTAFPEPMVRDLAGQNTGYPQTSVQILAADGGSFDPVTFGLKTYGSFLKGPSANPVALTTAGGGELDGSFTWITLTNPDGTGSPTTYPYGLYRDSHGGTCAANDVLAHYYALKAHKAIFAATRQQYACNPYAALMGSGTNVKYFDQTTGEFTPANGNGTAANLQAGLSGFVFDGNGTTFDLARAARKIDGNILISNESAKYILIPGGTDGHEWEVNPATGMLRIYDANAWTSSPSQPGSKNVQYPHMYVGLRYLGPPYFQQTASASTDPTGDRIGAGVGDWAIGWMKALMIETPQGYKTIWEGVKGTLRSNGANPNLSAYDPSASYVTGAYAIGNSSIPFKLGAGFTGNTTLTTALTTGSAITSLHVAAVPSALSVGATITLTSGANTQVWVLTAAAAKNATTLAVASQVPNFAYPVGSSAKPSYVGNNFTTPVTDPGADTTNWNDFPSGILPIGGQWQKSGVNVPAIAPGTAYTTADRVVGAFNMPYQLKSGSYTTPSPLDDTDDPSQDSRWKLATDCLIVFTPDGGGSYGTQGWYQPYPQSRSAEFSTYHYYQQTASMQALPTAGSGSSPPAIPDAPVSVTPTAPQDSSFTGVPGTALARLGFFWPGTVPAPAAGTVTDTGVIAANAVAGSTLGGFDGITPTIAAAAVAASIVGQLQAEVGVIAASAVATQVIAGFDTITSALADAAVATSTLGPAVTKTGVINAAAVAAQTIASLDTITAVITASAVTTQSITGFNTTSGVVNANAQAGMTVSGFRATTTAISAAATTTLTFLPIVAGVRTNLILDPNYEDGLATGWGANGMTGVVDTARAHSGTYSWKLTGNGTATAPFSGYYSVIAGLPYALSEWVNIPVGMSVAMFTGFINWYDNSPTPALVSQSLSPVLPASYVTSGPGGWERFSLVAVAPAGAAKVLVGLDPFTPATSDVLWVDDWLFEQSGVVGTMFAGDTPSTQFDSYAWTGAPYASASTDSQMQAPFVNTSSAVAANAAAGQTLGQSQVDVGVITSSAVAGVTFGAFVTQMGTIASNAVATSTLAPTIARVAGIAAGAVAGETVTGFDATTAVVAANAVAAETISGFDAITGVVTSAAVATMLVGGPATKIATIASAAVATATIGQTQTVISVIAAGAVAGQTIAPVYGDVGVIVANATAGQTMSGLDAVTAVVAAAAIARQTVAGFDTTTAVVASNATATATIGATHALPHAITSAAVAGQTLAGFDSITAVITAAAVAGSTVTGAVGTSVFMNATTGQTLGGFDTTTAVVVAGAAASQTLGGLDATTAVVAAAATTTSVIGGFDATTAAVAANAVASQTVGATHSVLAVIAAAATATSTIGQAQTLPAVIAAAAVATSTVSGSVGTSISMAATAGQTLSGTGAITAAITAAATATSTIAPTQSTLGVITLAGVATMLLADLDSISGGVTALAVATQAIVAQVARVSTIIAQAIGAQAIVPSGSATATILAQAVAAQSTLPDLRVLSTVGGDAIATQQVGSTSGFNAAVNAVAVATLQLGGGLTLQATVTSGAVATQVVAPLVTHSTVVASNAVAGTTLTVSVAHPGVVTSSAVATMSLTQSTIVAGGISADATTTMYIFSFGRRLITYVVDLDPDPYRFTLDADPYVVEFDGNPYTFALES